ncbi:hypothetical protein B0H63DRAFT_472085 [Podospora didyma]|uniref:Transcription initiation factor TFIID subunit 12 domain-containing protein n=1 Tax=Podospora didyma TaxID=330526 RepID=A0AAE0NNW0_9PEZI|nr:hypothetical protein B0H63DRAFT_472085 [Podospora didyma]
MNAPPGHGPLGHQNPQAPNGPPRPPGLQMYRPEQMRTMPYLSDEDKEKYEKGLALLWKKYEATLQNPTSEQNNEARQKIVDFGKMLMTKLQSMRQQQMLGQGGQTLQQPQQSPTAPPAAVLGGAGNNGSAPPQTPTTATTTMAPSNPAAAAMPQQANKPLPPHILNHVNDMVFEAPAGAPDKAKFVEEIRSKYIKALVQMEQMRSALTKVDQQLANPQGLSPQDIKARQDQKAGFQKQYQNALSFANLVRKQCASSAHQKQPLANGGGVGPVSNSNTAAGANPRPQGLGQQGPQGQQNQQGQQGQQAGVGIGIGAQQQQQAAGLGIGGASGPNSLQMHNSTVAVSAAIDAAKKQQLAAAGRMSGANGLPGQQQNHTQSNQQQAPPSHQTQPGQVAAPQAQSQPSTPVTQHNPHNQPALTSHSQAIQNQQQMANHSQLQHQQLLFQAQQAQQAQNQQHIKIEQGTTQHIPTPLNTAIASGPIGIQSSGTPTQNSARVQTPQSATPTGANIRPLTHAAAIQIASQQPRSGSIPGPAGNTQGGTPASTQGVIGAAQQQGHPHAHPTQQVSSGQSTLSSKLPIPKTLPEKATQIPTPVPTMGGIGASRPTYSGGGSIGGVMNQPALSKTPAYQLEGEGERVLNKKKLDELVRQVCGGTAEGQEGNLLMPEVEESVLNLADAFVDSVLHSACRNAKERGSKVLEIRDIQLVLERTYNIRIPGYSSEELRTVRKVNPSTQWISKMSAVQAAKVMPGKGEQ